MRRALSALESLEHRGAAGADADTGDGAGILLSLPDEFLRAVAPAELPPAGAYGVGVLFLPWEAERAAELERLIEATVEAEGQVVAGWRDVPVDAAHAACRRRRVRAARPPARSSPPRRSCTATRTPSSGSST